MDGGAWWAAVHGVVKSHTQLNDFTFTFGFHALEKEMATHSSVLAWRIPGTGEPGGLPSMGSHRVGHNWSDLAAAAADMYSRTLGNTSKNLKNWTSHIHHPAISIFYTYSISFLLRNTKLRPFCTLSPAFIGQWFPSFHFTICILISLNTQTIFKLSELT